MTTFAVRCLRPALPMNRANLRCLGLSVGIAIALSGCGDDPLANPPEQGILRIRLFQQCVKDATGFTPTTVADRGSWSEVVDKCGSAAYFQTNTCAPNYRACLDAIAASGIETRSATDPKGRGPKGESPVAKGETPKTNPVEEDRA